MLPLTHMEQNVVRTFGLTWNWEGLRCRNCAHSQQCLASPQFWIWARLLPARDGLSTDIFVEDGWARAILDLTCQLRQFFTSGKYLPLNTKGTPRTEKCEWNACFCFWVDGSCHKIPTVVGHRRQLQPGLLRFCYYISRYRQYQNGDACLHSRVFHHVHASLGGLWVD
jgi:hypothetical protein